MWIHLSERAGACIAAGVRGVHLPGLARSISLVGGALNQYDFEFDVKILTCS